MIGKFVSFLIVGLTCLASANNKVNTTKTFEITSEYVEFVVTSKAGGRVIHFSLPGKENVLLVNNELIAQAVPEISHFGEHIDYFGHTVWLGPQSHWWTGQSVNLQRREEKATWPPDPFVVLTENTIVQSSNTYIELRGTESPISHVQLSKSFHLLSKQNKIKLNAIARNTQQSTISNDIWFNTRVPDDAVIYVPLDTINSVRLDANNDPLKEYSVFNVEGGYLRMKNPKVFSTDIVRRRGKLFIQPSSNWIAAFVHQQLFIIEFQLNPPSSIHAEHGQVELYYDFSASPKVGLIELEVHSPFQTLLAGQSIQASEWWRVYSYEGLDTREAHLAFLHGIIDINKEKDIDKVNTLIK